MGMLSVSEKMRGMAGSAFAEMGLWRGYLLKS